MGSLKHSRPRLDDAIAQWWRRGHAKAGAWKTTGLFFAEIWDFLLESTSSRRRQRYGDVGFDWDYRVDTTSATVGWKDRLLGVFHSAYQPTDPVFFHEMMQALDIDFPRFTFIDLGSGKGRTLLMASEYPFQRIVGVELIPELHRIAEANLEKFHSSTQRCIAIESLWEDARAFHFPAVPTVLYLFNPLPEEALATVVRNLEGSLRQDPREFYVLYHNAVLRHVLDASPSLRAVAKGEYYLLYRSA
jgi:hypothetical protein